MEDCVGTFLTDEEIKDYIKKENNKTGVDGISEERLKSLDLDKIPELERSDDCLQEVGGSHVYERDCFTPKAGSIYLKPSFAGRQVLMGRIGRNLYFTHGVWFQIN